MQADAVTNFNLINGSSFSLISDSLIGINTGGFYQQIYLRFIEGQVKTAAQLNRVAAQVIRASEQALRFRQTKYLIQAGELLISLPLPPTIRSIGYYYTGLGIFWDHQRPAKWQSHITKSLRDQVSDSKQLLEKAADYAPAAYRARALTCLATSSIIAKDLQLSLSLFNDAIKLTKPQGGLNDALTACQVYRSISVIKSIEGDHAGALNLLKTINPLAYKLRYSYPHEYFAYQNSLAVELSEVGDLRAAGYFSNIALASPFAVAYPEWSETGVEIDEKLQRQASRSIVPVAKFERFERFRNVQALPIIPHRADEAQNEPAKVFNLEKWVKMKADEQAKKKTTDSENSLDELEYELFKQLKRNPITSENAEKYRRIIEILKEKDGSGVEEK